jgi:glycine/D-amino acid oxidase-like deaminating enzyme
MADTTLDAVVIGGGPAGAVRAATLAQQGRSVLVLTQRAFPRFHISTSDMTPQQVFNGPMVSGGVLAAMVTEAGATTTLAQAQPYASRRIQLSIRADTGTVPVNYLLRRCAYWNRK